MRNFMINAIIIFVGLLFFAGCSGGNSPVTPDNGNLSGVADSHGRALWGLWQCSMEPGSNEIEIVPMRTAAFTANVTKLLEGEPGNLQIKELDLTNFESEGLLPCTVSLRHPFPGLDQFHGFDVRGVFLHNGQSMLNYDGLTYSGGPNAGPNEAVLLNADGYTRWFNYPEFAGTGLPILEFIPGKLSNLPSPTATLNPYKVFADGLGTYDDFAQWAKSGGNLNDRMIFRAGQVRSRRYELKFPLIGGVPKVDFQYSAIASWEPGDPELTGLPHVWDPFDFPSSANIEEAFLIDISTDSSDLYYADGSDFGGTFRADIEVFDWQGGIAAGNTVPNEIERIIIEGDFIPGGTHYWTQSELIAVASPGTENSSVFQVEITNCEPKNSGDSVFWVIVESGGMFGESYYQGYPTKYPESARRASFVTGNVLVDDESPYIPPKVHYVLDTGGLLSDFSGFDDISPALAWETDDRLRCIWASDDLYEDHPYSIPRGMRSDNGGVTWTDYQTYGSHGNARLRDHTKLMPANNGNSFLLYALSWKTEDNPFYEAGRSSDKSISWNYANMFVGFHDCGELLCASDGYIHVFGDKNPDAAGIFQKVGNQKWTWFYDWSGHPDPPPNWWWPEVPIHPVAPPPARNSDTRSIGDDSDGTFYLAYWGGPGNEFIKIAKSTDTFTALEWEQLTVFQQSGFSSVRDPGLDIDANDVVHVSFLRHNTSTGMDEVCYTYSIDGGYNWSAVKVAHSSENVMTDTPIEAYEAFGESIVAIAFEDGDSVWFTYSLDSGNSWHDPILVSYTGSSVDRMPDMVVGTDNNLHFAWSHKGANDWEIHFRNAVLVED
ncbi:MAG TPA: hypothetical protein ENN67_03980 [Firmicutes bacterium]|nr:hypothetical protein [Bacillota bacterium]